jgi:hypothetical protein
MMNSPKVVSEFEAIAKAQYCVVGQDGELSQNKLTRVVDALEAAAKQASGQTQKETLPIVAGVPRLKATLDRVEDIPIFVARYLHGVERDPILHALSFVNPLKLATDELGIAVSPLVARFVRRQFRGSVSFADGPKVPGQLTGVTNIRWVPKGRGGKADKQNKRSIR